MVRDDLALLLSERFAVAGHDGSASGQPSTTAARRAPRSLPVTSTSLIGREHDIDEVSDLLELPEVRLVTLTGPGGIGKTRLAIAVGARLEERSSRHTVFVSLASIAQPELVMPRVAAVVGATIEGTRAPVDVLARTLRRDADVARARQPRTSARASRSSSTNSCPPAPI